MLRWILALLLLVSLASPALAAEAPLRWGVDLQGGAPYAFADPRDPSRVIGFEAEMAQALSRHLHRPMVRVQTNWESLIPTLDRGGIDFAMNGIELTPEHERAARFTRPYYVYQEQIVVRKGETRIHRLEDLRGMRVGTLTASEAERMLERLGGVDIERYEDMYAIYQDLVFGRIDAVFLDRPIAVYYARGNPKLAFVEPPVGEGLYAIAVRPADRALAEQLDAALHAMLRDGEQQRILAHWGLYNPAQVRLFGWRTTDAPLAAAKAPVIWSFLPYLLAGARLTVILSVLAMALAMALGLVLAVARLYGPWPLRALTSAYIELFRGTPLLIQLYLLYYGLPRLGVRLDAFVAGVLGLGLNYAAYEAETARAGILAVPHGQTEASLSLGFTRLQMLRYVILPQAIRVALPPVTNDFIALFKDSSLVSVITLVELTKAYGMLASATYDYMGLGLLTAGLYFAMSYPASRFARWVEGRLQHA